MQVGGEDGLLHTLAQWLWAVVLAVVGLASRLVLGKIDSVEKRIENLERRQHKHELVDAETHARVDSLERGRDEMRQNVISLFNKLDEIKDLIRSTGGGGRR